MPDTVAVLSDIHGVLPALEAVLAEPAVRDADVIVLTGDMATGPQPVATLDRLVGLGDRVRWVKGNCERVLVEQARGAGPSPFAISDWAAEQLRPDQVELLDGLPATLTLDVDGFGDVLFCHATPRDDEEMVFVDSDLPRWAEVLAGVPDDVRTIVCGHTHMPFTRLVDRRTIVNAGSVGMPYGTTGAQWALLTNGAVTLRRTEFDRAAACATIEADSSTCPGIAEWTNDFVRNPPSDSEALTSFKEQLARKAN
ncbi:MAG TPA: metallophosphoesterase family protein [Actinophytocola sp.]|jgi:predicted phosphodiesterase|uniref:metallophosphoesterase family protein n=1 Tax=Actinophytocola sp. TaxID=1872138 RepID=UPI002F9409BE